MSHGKSVSVDIPKRSNSTSDSDLSSVEMINIPSSYEMKNSLCDDLVSVTSDKGGEEGELTMTDITLHPPVPVLDSEGKPEVSSLEEFLEALAAPKSSCAFVVCAVGGRGNGRSYMLNMLLSKEYFPTRSEDKPPPPAGISAALDAPTGLLAIDTLAHEACCSDDELLLRNRAVYKAMAISDVVVYRSRSHGIPGDTFKFLHGYTVSYANYLSKVLHAARTVPQRLVFLHDCHSGGVLQNCSKSTALAKFLRMAKENRAPLSDFSSVEYIGATANSLHTANGNVKRNEMEGPEWSQPCSQRSEGDMFQYLKEYVLTEAGKASHRSVTAIYDTFECLANKFNDPVIRTIHYPELLFTCPKTCLVCDKQCSEDMLHSSSRRPRRTEVSVDRVEEDGYVTFGLNDVADSIKDSLKLDTNCSAGKRRDIKMMNILEKTDNTRHINKHSCIKTDGYDNERIVCKRCGEKVQPAKMPPDSLYSYCSTFLSSAISGPSYDCAKCGSIAAADTKSTFEHVWNDNYRGYNNSPPVARLLYEGASLALVQASQSASLVLEQASNTVADLNLLDIDSVKTQIRNAATPWVNPPYWKPDIECTHCDMCATALDSGIHHCRDCGGGFCAACSNHKAFVRHRGHNAPKRVCGKCLATPGNGKSAPTPTDVTPRGLMEGATSVAATLATAAGGYVEALSRPNYWSKDCTECHLCKVQFGQDKPSHTCRDCGKPVCGACSPMRAPVPARSWAEKHVRVCDACVLEPGGRIGNL